ncbi:RICIN domain-containing protein [Streptacidiphilus neutrinimicus]|uniref:RICIN domain-containing protein n=1 Tax=Streptacidiphilus neutrinimicus TaxID=105420 RepID=UPI0005A6C3E4|nr:RICIN domain-containing protein [Streptacidiphilus neutrinimicus]
MAEQPTRRHLARTAIAAALAAGALVASQSAATAAPGPRAVTTSGSSLQTGPVNLYNQWTGRCADLPNYGSNPPNTLVSQFDCVFAGWDNQQYTIVPTRTVDGPFGPLHLVEFVNIASNQCLDLPGYGSVPATTQVSIYPCAGDPSQDNQEWYVNDTGSGNDEIINYKDNLCLDVAGWASDNSDQGNGKQLTVYPCYSQGWGNGGYDDHLWNLRSS